VSKYQYLTTFVYKLNNFSRLFRCVVGLSDGAIFYPGKFSIGECYNSYGIPNGSFAKRTTDGAILYPGKFSFGEYYNSYGIPNGHFYCSFAKRTHFFELSEETIQSRWKPDSINVLGCGLVLDPEDKLAIFFTLNGQLRGKLVLEIFRGNKKISCIFSRPHKSNYADRKIPISPEVDELFPTVTTLSIDSSLEANFGDDPAKPFEYDIKNCPGLGLTCI
jgi:hypothetical protein